MKKEVHYEIHSSGKMSAYGENEKEIEKKVVDKVTNILKEDVVINKFFALDFKVNVKEVKNKK